MNMLSAVVDEPAFLYCRHRFPALLHPETHGVRVFADNSSRAQMPDTTVAAVYKQHLSNETHRGGNPDWDSPRAAHMAALRARARAAAAAFCGGTPAQIGFAANGTSTLAILARALLNTVLAPGDAVVITEADHDANRAPWQALARLGCRILDVPVAADGSVERGAWEAALAQGPKVVALCMISNVTGVVLPCEELAAQAKAAGAVVVLDAVQGPPHGYLRAMRPDVDVAIFSNCKLFSPHLGWWAIREELLERMRLSPPVAHHPELEWGTLGHAAYAGFVATLDYFCGLSSSGDLVEAMASVRQHERSLCRRFLQRLPESLRPALLALETPHERVPIFSLALPRERWAKVRRAFESAAIDVRIGQFGCPATLERLVPHPGSAALRLSFVHYNTADDIDAVCDVLRLLETRFP